MQLQHLRHNNIDYERWDKTISLSVNHFIYAFSWYLDVVSPGWEALVSENYEYVMPLPVKRKYGFNYIVQPVLTQQLGIFSSKKINEDIVLLFIKKIPYYSYEINLNECNFNEETSKLPNYILSLDKTYETIYKEYSVNTIRNIKKAKKNNLIFTDKLEIKKFIEFHTSTERNFKTNFESVLANLLTIGKDKEAVDLLGITNSKNELISALCLLISRGRMIFLLPVSNKEGKTSSAMFMLVDELIKNKAKTNTILDFEGSKIEGIARFYKGFGAINQPYYILKRFRPSFLIGKI